MAYVMEIDGVFRIGDGRTIFTGSASEADPSTPMKCVVTVEGEPTERLTIQGVEMLVLTAESVQAGRRIESRAVSTYEPVRLTKEVVDSSRCQLREENPT